jgi:DNA-binding CsgD family transcriptional regulator
VAAELERSAGRAHARGGLAAAAAFLERATELTPEPARRAQRALAAAQAALEAGASDAALALLATARAGPPDELHGARVARLHAMIGLVTRFGRDAAPLLLEAAKRLEPLDLALARGAYLDALWTAVVFADGDGPLDAAKAARAAGPAPQPARAPDLFLDGLIAAIIEGHAAGAAKLKQGLRVFRGDDISSEEAVHWHYFACHMAIVLWDDESWEVLCTRHVQLARETGALGLLLVAFYQRMGLHEHAGELAAAASLLEEAKAVAEATGNHFAPYAAMKLSAWRGREAEASRLIEASVNDAAARGEAMGLAIIRWASALLYNGLGRYEEALGAAQLASAFPLELAYPTWALVELIEAAVCGGTPEPAAGALRRLSDHARVSGGDWALGIEARSRALLSDGEAAERLYREAIERLGRTRIRPELARAHLLYGEWLRRENRRPDAREQLRTAHQMLSAMGVDGFAARAARELQASGETVRKRTAKASAELTAQEAQIARLARDGLSNADIGARLFISPRTAEYHLSKVFAKLGISARQELERVLPTPPDAAQRV